MPRKLTPSTPTVLRLTAEQTAVLGRIQRGASIRGAARRCGLDADVVRGWLAGDPAFIAAVRRAANDALVGGGYDDDDRFLRRSRRRHRRGIVTGSVMVVRQVAWLRHRRQAARAEMWGQVLDLYDKRMDELMRAEQARPVRDRPPRQGKPRRG